MEVKPLDNGRNPVIVWMAENTDMRYTVYGGAMYSPHQQLPEPHPHLRPNLRTFCTLFYWQVTVFEELTVDKSVDNSMVKLGVGYCELRIVELVVIIKQSPWNEHPPIEAIRDPHHFLGRYETQHKEGADCFGFGLFGGIIIAVRSFAGEGAGLVIPVNRIFQLRVPREACPILSERLCIGGFLLGGGTGFRSVGGTTHPM